ncbi:MAG: hypothetical protein RL375_598 [Pseudomonadota bacterium]
MAEHDDNHGEVEALRAEVARQRKIIQALMDRAERSTEVQGSDFSLFQAAIMLDEQVRARTADLDTALRDNARINAALRESEARYRAVVDQSLVGIAVIDGNCFTYTNPQFDQIFGYPTDEMRALGPLDVAHPDDHALVREQVRLRLAGESDRVHYRLRCQRKDGEPLVIEIYGNTIDLDGRRQMVSVVQDVTERSRAEAEVQALQVQLRELSLRDALTGLYNRRYLDESLPRELVLSQRLRHPVSVILGDLDHFKRINDHHGHQAGDQVLRSFAGLLERSARASDINCRYGGEEFLLVLPRMSKADALQRAEQLRRALSTSGVTLADRVLRVTASFGVACYPQDADRGDALIAAADAALYVAKGAGRDRVVAAPGLAPGESSDAAAGPAPSSLIR